LLSQGSPPSKPPRPTPRPTTAVPGVYITVAAAAAAERIAALPPTSNACGRRKVATFAWSTSSVRHRAQEAAGKATMTDGGDSQVSKSRSQTVPYRWRAPRVKNPQLRGGGAYAGPRRRSTIAAPNCSSSAVQAVAGKSQARALARAANPGRHRLIRLCAELAQNTIPELTRRVSEDNGQRWQSEV
jgi:hypothetical protein